MSLKDVKEVKNHVDYPLPKKGLRLGTLSGIIDVGIQPREFAGKPKSPARMVLFQYTLVNDHFVDDDGNKRHLKISDGPFTLSPGADKGKYMDHVKALDPEAKLLAVNGAGDVTKLIGNSAYLTLVHTDPKPDGKVYANIEGVTQLPEDFQVPVVAFDKVLFDSTDPTPESVALLNEYQKGLVRKSVNYAGSKLEAAIDGANSTPAQAAAAQEQEDEDSPI